MPFPLNVLHCHHPSLLMAWTRIKLGQRNAVSAIRFDVRGGARRLLKGNELCSCIHLLPGTKRVELSKRGSSAPIRLYEYLAKRYPDMEIELVE